MSTWQTMAIYFELQPIILKPLLVVTRKHFFRDFDPVLPENLEELFPWYYLLQFQIFKHSLMDYSYKEQNWPITTRERSPKRICLNHG